MRTTVTINDELLAGVRQIAAREHRTIGSVVEEAVRLLLAEQQHASGGVPYRLPRFNAGNPGPRPGVDLTDKEQLADLIRDDQQQGATH